MSSTVYQGLQSVFETRLVEQRALCLRLVSPMKQENPTEEDLDMELTPRKCSHNHTAPEEFRSFFSITSLSDAPQEKSNYIPPPLPLRRSSSSLSEKSLELCTENLGCETGSNITEDNYFPSPSPSASFHQSQINRSWEDSRKGKSTMNRKDKSSVTFPPPLTSIAGAACIHVKPHREEGRLVLKAVTSPSPRTYFQAERSDGRLRLRLLNTTSSLTADKEEEEEEEEEEEKEDKDQDSKEEAAEKEEMGDMGYLDMSRNVEVVNGSESCGGEIGMGKIQRPSNRRCNGGEHGNKGMLSWELLWVASS